MEIVTLDLTDEWATRELRICVRALGQLSPNARLLVEHLRSSGTAGAANAPSAPNSRSPG
jgi:hypothetical protein